MSTENDAALTYLKTHNLDGFKREALQFIAETLIFKINKSGTFLPKLSRDAKRTTGKLNLWFYDNREILTPWLQLVRTNTQDPLPVMRQKTHQEN